MISDTRRTPSRRDDPPGTSRWSIDDHGRGCTQPKQPHSGNNSVFRRARKSLSERGQRSSDGTIIIHEPVPSPSSMIRTLICAKDSSLNAYATPQRSGASSGRQAITSDIRSTPPLLPDSRRRSRPGTVLLVMSSPHSQLAHQPVQLRKHTAQGEFSPPTLLGDPSPLFLSTYPHGIFDGSTFYGVAFCPEQHHGASDHRALEYQAWSRGSCSA